MSKQSTQELVRSLADHVRKDSFDSSALTSTNRAAVGEVVERECALLSPARRVEITGLVVELLRSVGVQVIDSWRPHPPVTDLGCHLDGAVRGQHVTRDVVILAQDLGFILDGFKEWALETYDEHSSDDEYPHEALSSLCDDAVSWLNCGDDAPEGQNLPPIVPDGASWEFSDGDFGLYLEDTSEDDSCVGRADGGDS
jgi:hypothetical protein